MIRVAHLITTLDVGGAETALTRVLQRSDRQRFEHLVVSLSGEGPLASALRNAGVQVRAVVCRRHNGPLAVVRAVHMVRRWRPDVLQTWLYRADVVGTLVRVACGSSLAWNLRCSNSTALTGRFGRVCVWLSRCPDIVVANSVAGQRFHEAIGYRPAEWRVIPNGFDTRIFQPDDAARAAVRRVLSIRDDDPVIGLFARVDPLKDHDTFFRAAGLLSARHDRVQFIVAGAGTEGFATRIAASPALAGRVRCLGLRNDIPKLTAALDVATCCSIAEGFPNTVGEAMAVGVPCVVTDVGDAALIVADTGVVVPPRDPAALAAGWERLLALAVDERRALGARARQRVERLYSLDCIADRYGALWTELDERRRSRRAT